jgi:class 3 adenylate cyclase
VLFCDLVGWTAQAEQLEPEVATAVLSEVRHVISASVDRYGGSVLQFQGDGAFACFGHETAHEDDTRRAVLAGLEMRDRVAELRNDLYRRLAADVHVRVAVHSGTMVIVAPTSGGPPEVVGSPTNVVARLQTVAAADTVVVSDVSRHLVGADFEMAALGPHALKGLAQELEVYEVLRAADPDERLGTVRLTSAPLCGRKTELQWTLDRCREPQDATGRRAAILRGPAGIGKSRLVAEVSHHFEEQGVPVLRAACSPYHARIGLWPISRLVARLLHLDATDPPEKQFTVISETLSELGLGPRSAPLVAWLLGIPAGWGNQLDGVDATTLRRQARSTLVDWVEAAAGSRHLLAVLEDAQWADPSTVEFVGELLARRPAGVVLLLTARESIAELGALCDELVLAPLGDADADQLAEKIGQGSLAPGRREEIVRRAGGVPLFVAELTRASLTFAPGAPLPFKLQEVLTARIHLPGIDLGVAQLAATVGHEFEVHQLESLTGGALGRALPQLLDQQIIEPADRGSGRYRFAHALLRDAAYETQPLDLRRHNHSLVAQALTVGDDPLDAGRAAIVARHLDLANERAAAVERYLEAARLTLDSAGYEESRLLLDRGLELAAQMSHESDQRLVELLARLLHAAAVSATQGFAHPDVAADYDRAAELCESLGNRPETLPALVGIWAYLIVSGRGRAARQVIERAAAIVGKPQNAAFAPEIHSCLGYTEWYAGRLREARRALQAAWDGYVARPPADMTSPFWTQPHDSIASTSIAMAGVAWLEGRSQESDEWVRRAVERIGVLPANRARLADAYVAIYRGWLEMIKGNPDLAREQGDRVASLCDRYGLDYYRLLGRTCSQVPSADHTTDPAELEATLRALDAIGHRAFRAANLAGAAQNWAYLGDPRRALECTDLALAAIEESDERLHEPGVRRLRAHIQVAVDGDGIAFARELRRALLQAEQQGAAGTAASISEDLARLISTAPATKPAVLD